MSRTYKDKPYKLKHEPWDKDRGIIEGTWRFVELPTTKTKKRKEVDTECHWMTTPSWWNRIWHNRPERRKATVLLASLPADLDEVDVPDLGRKPHIYFW